MSGYEHKPTPVVIETNHGGMRTVICGCGSFVLATMEGAHVKVCPILADYRERNPKGVA